MGGVMNFISRRQEKEGFTGGARFAYGSFNTAKMMGHAGYRKNGFHLFASLNRDVTDGHRVNSAFEINNAFIRSGYRINPNLEILADYNIASFNSTDPGAITSSAAPFVADIVRGRTSFTVKNEYDNLKGGLTAFLNFGDHELSDGWVSKDENKGISLYQSVQLPFNSMLSAGADMKAFGGRGNSGMAANQWLSINENGVWALMRHQLLRVINISYGVRIEDNSMYGTELLPQAGIAWQATSTSVVKGSVSKGFRSPTIMETYLFLPNPELKPERMMSYEAGFSQSMLNGRLHGDLNIFMLEGSNIIRVVPNPTPPPPGRRVNTGEFQNYGFETELRYAATEDLFMDFSWSYLETQTPLLAAPRHQLFAGVNYSFSRFRMATNAQYISGLYSYIHNPMQSQFQGEDIIQNYLLLNASLSYKVLRFAEIFISGKNLLDQTYQINNGYPMPGAHFMSGVGFKI
jgi:outer membrane receptor protein involved in Fe transport